MFWMPAQGGYDEMVVLGELCVLCASVVKKTMMDMAIKMDEWEEAYEGTFTKDAPIGARSWFGCGGAADVLFEPAGIDDLALFLREYPLFCHPDPGLVPGEGSYGGVRDSSALPQNDILVLGGMANCIIRDGGVRGVVVRLGKPFAEVEVQGNRILAGAGALNGSVASAAAKAGIGGLEFLSGIPGTIGGALAMNAGAYGSEVRDVLIAAMTLDAQGRTVPLSPEDLQMGYRTCAVPEGSVFTGVIFEGKAEDTDTVRARLKSIKAQRQDTQPITEKTGGSTFANPLDETLAAAGLPEGTRAWQLVEKVGGRGLRIGGAQMSEKHCNFMINTGSATAAELEALGDELIRRVYEDCGVRLHWEIRRIGEFCTQE